MAGSIPGAPPRGGVAVHGVGSRPAGAGGQSDSARWNSILLLTVGNDWLIHVFMKTRTRSSRSRTIRTTIRVLVPATCVVLAAAWLGRPDPAPTVTRESGTAEPRVQAGVTDPAPGRSEAAPAFTGAAKPLPAVSSTDRHEWTDADMADPAVIQLVAHNPDEALRMIEENDRIHRRQLVYRKLTAAAVVQQAMADGGEVRQLTLPGLDGRELEFVIERADLAPSGQTGSFVGHLAGKPGSQVSLGYRFGREAFTVISPDDDLYLQADPRQPGELIVKAIDPGAYVPGVCGNPNHTH